MNTTHTRTLTIAGAQWTYDVADFWQLAHGLPTEDLDLEAFLRGPHGYTLRALAWDPTEPTPDGWAHVGSVLWVAHHARPNPDADRFPVILSPDGRILDGFHRILRALLRGETTIWAQRLERMPPPMD